MSHSINHQFIHLLWATKNLSPLITEDSRSLLLGYMTGILKELGGQVFASSATPNHVHLLANTPTNLSIADLLRRIKSSSSTWYRDKGINQNEVFSWNEGYSAFTVSPSSTDNVKRYLATEEHRHEKDSFQDELEKFLKIQEIEFNSKFLTTTTFTKLIYHLVWSVKNRELMLETSLQRGLHDCLEQEIEKNGCKLYAIGNVADHIHIHILMECSKNISTASLVQKLKTTTSHLISSQKGKWINFSWQEGYGVFSVGKPAFNSVLNYVNNQEKHHSCSSNTFEQEWNWLKGL